MKGPNPIIKFLEGDWYCTNFITEPNKKVTKSEYKEKMVIKDTHIITITAYGINNGENLTRDMTIIVDNNNDVTLKQGDFQATGKLDGNMASISNESYKGNKYTFRLYLMDDKYIYQKDLWKDDTVIQTQMSYLERL